MFWLILIASLPILALVWRGLRLVRLLSGERARAGVLDRRYGIISRQLKEQRLTKGLLESEYENVAALYEVTRDISRALDRDKIFRTFRKIVPSFVDIDDCLLFPAGQKITEDMGLVGYSVFPLKIGGEQAGVLAVKGVRDKDRGKLDTLANQLALVIKRAELYRTIQELSITDSLTQVLLKRYCLRRFREEVARSRKRHFSMACLMFDIDNFKSYNDRFGHLFGDIVLTEVARIIRENIREIDLLGRFGGEEFLLVLPETDKQAALVVAERIRSDIGDKEISAYDEKLKVTISIGVAVFPEDGERYKELLDKSDQALYRAKQAGKNRVVAVT